ncbi:MAG: penicillin-binding transpeptidase domain-containing protein [Lachnospiraceae bacterium]|nr:penicillin-binding transpeptidase domain-containing protein [Lachnospiraceae bacterium]
MKRKLAGLFVMVVLVLVMLAVRITYINASSGDQYSKQVLAQSQQQYQSRTLPFQRGDILDANGTVLATSEKVYNVILDCKVINTKEDYRQPTLTALKEVLGVEEDTVTALLDDEKTKSSQYHILIKDVTIKEKRAFEEYCTGTDDNPLTGELKIQRARVKGIWFEEDYKRKYPLNSLACDVLGFTYSDNSADWGIEGYYDNTLNGVDGREYGYFNQDSDLEQTVIQPVDGSSVVTTIDVNIQQVVEKYIQAFEDNMSGGPFGTDGAKNIGVIVANPNNGEILAMASSDPYDLNNPRDLTGFYSAEEIAAMNDEQTLDALNVLWRNYCISEAFEPGSTVKPLTVASALEDASLNGDETFYCDGYQMVSGTKIKCSNTEGHGEETLSDVIKNSCNDGLMQIAEKMGIEEFVKYQKVFNFGHKTGIDLSGEAGGLLFNEQTMSSVELATSSFGQGYTCTMVQEMAAICSVINGGYYYQPHVISKVLDSKGSTIKTVEPIMTKQTISSEVSSLIRSYMQASVESGTSEASKVPGYSSGGKTGTAQKIPRGNGKYLVSFIGFTPADDPEVAIYVVVDEPNTDAQANSKYPQYISKAIMTEILPYLNIFPDEEVTGEEKIDAGDFLAKVVAEDGASEDATVDTNVPEPDISEEDITGGDNEESDGLTNEEAGLSE